MKLDLTRKRFVAWLRDNQDLEFERQSCDMCPIAIFLGSFCDHDVDVDIEEIMVDSKSFETPPWAEKFIRAFDKSDGAPTGKLALSLFPAGVRS